MRALIILIVVPLIGLFFICPKVEGEDWNVYAEITEEDMKFYYNAESINHISKNNVRVWIKEVHLSEKGKNEIIQLRKKFGLPTEDFKNFKFTLELWEINCADNKHKLLSYIYYDNKNSVLDLYHSDSDRWAVIVPHSVGEILYEVVCLQTML
jgi:hypothetical protein